VTVPQPADTGELDLLLINAPIHDYDRYPRYDAIHSPPLGLLSIATSVDLAGFTVEVYDAELNQASPTQVRDLVQRRKPGWVGINAFSVNIEVVRRVISLLGAGPWNIVLGGPHITNVSNEHAIRYFGNEPVFVRGDGEQPMIDLLNGRSPAQITGAFTGYSGGASDARSISNDLSELPIIDRRFSDGEPFLRLQKNWYGLTLSRGCLFRCSFCAGSSHSNGIPYRSSSMSRTFAELDYLVGLGASGIRLFDDLPFKGKRPLLSFLMEINNQFGPTLSWDINFPLQYCMTLSNDDWRLLAQCGVNTLIFGVEAADPTLRATLGKRVDDTGLWRVIRAASEYEIALRLYFIIGVPGESAESTDQTIALATKLASLPDLTGPEPITCSVFAYKPMPGSQLWSDLLRKGYSEDQLLQYTDFEMSVKTWQKHAWQSSLKLSELTPNQLAARIDAYYTAANAANPRPLQDSIASAQSRAARKLFGALSGHFSLIAGGTASLDGLH
jgi:anaerobic magnesium-protoporphyrin IX monomethyl ester cyclase